MHISTSTQLQPQSINYSSMPKTSTAPPESGSGPANIARRTRNASKKDEPNETNEGALDKPESEKPKLKPKPKSEYIPPLSRKLGPYESVINPPLPTNTALDPVDFELRKFTGLIIKSTPKNPGFTQEFVDELSDLAASYMNHLITLLHTYTEAQRHRLAGVTDLQMCLDSNGVTPTELYGEYERTQKLSPELRKHAVGLRTRLSQVLALFHAENYNLEKDDPSLVFHANEQYEIAALVPRQLEPKTYIPSYFPDLPPDFTYQNTGSYMKTITDLKQIKLKMVEESRLNEKSLYKLIEDDDNTWMATLEDDLDALHSSDLESDHDDIMSVNGDQVSDAESPQHVADAKIGKEKEEEAKEKDEKDEEERKAEEENDEKVEGDDMDVDEKPKGPEENVEKEMAHAGDNIVDAENPAAAEPSTDAVPPADATVEPSVQTAVESTAESTVQPTTDTATEPTVEPTVEHTVNLTAEKQSETQPDLEIVESAPEVIETVEERPPPRPDAKFDFVAYAKKRRLAKEREERAINERRHKRLRNIFMRAEKSFSCFAAAAPKVEEVEYFQRHLEKGFKKVILATRLAEKEKKARLAQLQKERSEREHEQEQQNGAIEFGFTFNPGANLLDSEDEDGDNEARDIVFDDVDENPATIEPMESMEPVESMEPEPVVQENMEDSDDDMDLENIFQEIEQPENASEQFENGENEESGFENGDTPFPQFENNPENGATANGGMWGEDDQEESDEDLQDL